MNLGRKRLILIACTLGSTIAFVDSSVVNVALPAIQEDLGGGLPAQQWVANAYLLTLGALLLVGGSLGDLYGQRRLFAIGLGSFGAFSALCTVAPTAELLIVGRALQGVAAAAVVPMALALITTNFEPGERGRAIGTWTAWSGVGVALGPLIGGQLVDAGSWRLVFAINLPLIALALALALAFIPESGRRPGRRIDLGGAILCSVSLAAITFGLLRQPTAGWADGSVAIPLLGGLGAFAGFLRHEHRSQRPMLPLALFRRRNFAIGNLETFAMYGAIGLFFFYLVIYLQQVAGYSALQAGASMLPVTLLLLLLAGRFGALADKYGPRIFMTGGPIVAAAGLFLLLRIGLEVDFASQLLPAVLLFSLGLAMTVAPLTATVLGDVDEADAGIASGANNAIARLAGMIGIAVVGVVMAATFAAGVEDRLDAAGLTPRAAEIATQAAQSPLIEPAVGSLLPDEAEQVRDAVSEASLTSFRQGMGITAGAMLLAGLLGAAIRNPRRPVASSDCPGGQLVAQPKDAARRPEECRDSGTASTMLKGR